MKSIGESGSAIAAAAVFAMAAAVLFALAGCPSGSGGRGFAVEDLASGGGDGAGERGDGAGEPGDGAGPRGDLADAGPGCGNGRKDGDETDVDCGGGACGPCANGRACLRGGD